MPVLARHGPLDLSLDEVADRAGVTRNLLYHYFPGGRADLVAAAVEEAERQLLPAWAPARAQPDPEALSEAVARVFDHALAPTHAWRIHRLARGAGGAAAGTIVERSTREVVGTLLALHGLAEDPTPLTELALRGYVAYAEAVLDGARGAGIARADIQRMLAQALRAIVASR
jgi:AcrR family transcriptional regulator